MMFNENDLIQQVQNIIGSDLDNPILIARAIPESYTGKTCNIYRSTPSRQLPYSEMSYTANIRADEEWQADEIGYKLLEGLNRANSNSIYYRCSLLPIIPPVDETDNFNAVVEIVVNGELS